MDTLLLSFPQCNCSNPKNYCQSRSYKLYYYYHWLSVLGNLKMMHSGYSLTCLITKKKMFRSTFFSEWNGIFSYHSPSLWIAFCSKTSSCAGSEPSSISFWPAAAELANPSLSLSRNPSSNSTYTKHTYSIWTRYTSTWVGCEHEKWSKAGDNINLATSLGIFLSAFI